MSSEAQVFDFALALEKKRRQGGSGTGGAPATLAIPNALGVSWKLSTPAENPAPEEELRTQMEHNKAHSERRAQKRLNRACAMAKHLRKQSDKYV